MKTHAVELSLRPVAYPTVQRPTSMASGERTQSPRVKMNSSAGITALAPGAAIGKPKTRPPAKFPSVTDERVLFDVQSRLFGLGVGFTLSETTRIKHGSPSKEIVRVAGRDGTAFEYNAVRKPLGDGRHFELQGPGVGLAGRHFQLRFFGVALSGEKKVPDSAKAISYTVEIKLDQKTLARTIAFAGVKAGRSFVRTLVRSPLLRHVGKAIGVIFHAAVPVLGGVVACCSITNAIRTWKQPEASWVKKLTSIAHAVCDLVFIANPVVGTIGGLAVSGISIAHWLITKRDASHQAPATAASL